MTIHARLFDADGHDTGFDPSAGMPTPHERRLVWIDADARDADDLGLVGSSLDLSDGLLTRLASPDARPRVTQYPDHVHLSVVTLDADDTARTLEIIAGRDWVATVHDGEMPAIARILDGIEGETRLGALEAGGFLAAIVDSVIVGYYALVEDLEREIDVLDEAALARRSSDDVLAGIVRMRRRISRVRRVLAPHREALAVLGRPDMALHDELGQPWPDLLDRLEGAVDSVEQLREALIGTYDIFMGRAAQRDSAVMKTLTVLSAVLLPSVVLAGVMGMNFKVGFFDTPENFWVIIGAMGLLAAAILATARARGWL
jgi:magnesium transporter